MPKMKTNSGAKKRFKLTAKGKIKRAKANKRHILTKKGATRKRRLRKSGLVHETQTHQVMAMLPYAK